MIELTNEVISDECFSNETFRFTSGWQDFGRIERCTFTDCAIEFEGDARCKTKFQIIDCVGVGTSIRTLGPSVVGVRIWGGKFEQLDDGEPCIAVDHNACDEWIIYDVALVRLGHIGVRIRSSGVHVELCNFENKLHAAALAHPHIAVEPYGAFAGGLVDIVGNRFAGEVGSGAAGPPAYNVRLGPETPTTGTMTGIHLRDNRHNRRNGGPSATGGVGAVLITKDIKESSIRDRFQEFGGPLITRTALGGGPRDNVFDSIIDSAKHTAGIFDASGAAANGWTVR